MFNKNNPKYKKLWRKGYHFCDFWLKFLRLKKDMYSSYLKHVELNGERDTSIERIDNNGIYCKSTLDSHK